MALGLIVCTQKLSFVELEDCHNKCEKLLWIKSIQGSLPVDCDFSLFVCFYQKSSVKLLILLVIISQYLVMVLFF